MPTYGARIRKMQNMAGALVTHGLNTLCLECF